MACIRPACRLLVLSFLGEDNQHGVGIANSWPELLCVPEAPLARQLFAISCFPVASSNSVRLRFEWDAVFCRNLVVAGAAG